MNGNSEVRAVNGVTVRFDLSPTLIQIRRETGWQRGLSMRHSQSRLQRIRIADTRTRTVETAKDHPNTEDSFQVDHCSVCVSLTDGPVRRMVSVIRSVFE